MCQLSAYLVRSGEKKLVLEDVAMVQVEGGKVVLTTLFQQREVIDARIQTVDLGRNKLVLGAINPEKTEKMAETTDEQKLAIRLDHWIEHNTAHTREFQRGAEKANDLGYDAVRDEMLLAGEKLDEASDHLRRAAGELRQ